MISKVVIRRFKRFRKVEFDLPGHIVLAGPNNTGKTTLLQALAAWSLAFYHWKKLSDFQRHGGAYTKAPIARQAFSAVPMRAFDLLWNERRYREQSPIEIEVHATAGWKITIELIADSTEQIYVRPKPDVDPKTLREAELRTVYVPPMTGLSTDEPVYRRPKLDQLLGQGKPGDVLRNLLVEAHESAEAWPALIDCIQRLFGYEVRPPDASGADIIAEYRTRDGGPHLDIASAGSGFQQVLMLLTFLHTRPASVLLIDEPDAHLHIILQDAIYGELRSVALKQDSQLILATHSEVIIDSVDLRELYVIFDQPKRLNDLAERGALANALRHLSNTDIMLALNAPGILYVDDYTDIDILREWAKILDHPVHETLTTKLFWKKSVPQPREGAPGIRARDHYEVLKLVKPELPGLVLMDGDGRAEIPETELTGTGLQRQRWRRYEIESYLVHPAAIERFITHQVGPDAAPEHIQGAREYFEKQLSGVFEDPLGEHLILEGVKASERILPAILNAAGIPNFEKRRYYEIAAVMEPAEIHPEVREKLDAIQQAFSL
jgi:predicted ATPase